MKVEQAIYGEVRGGHGLRTASDSGRLPDELTSRLDLPDTAPPGADWSPYLSGFPHRDRYVFARTFSDSTATRAGMVLSHAVIAPLDEVSSMADLRPLLALLIVSPESPAKLEAREISTSTASPTPSVDLTAAAEAFTLRGIGPVVRIGHHGFEDLVISLWFHLWPEVRAGFAFRLSFGPQDLVEVPRPTLVCTPSALATRWANHRIVGSAPHSVSRAAEILSGGAGAEPVSRFAREIGARLGDLAELPLLDRAYELATASTSTFEECVAVLRLVERLSPDIRSGIPGKASVVDRLVLQLHNATASDVLLLRNVLADAFPAAKTLWGGLRVWAANNRFVKDEDMSLILLIDDATSAEAAIPAWRKAILSGLSDATHGQSSSFAAAFWRWAEASSKTLIALFDHMDFDPDLESRLASAAPNDLSQIAGEAVMNLAFSKGWFHLYGVAAGACLAPQEAIRRQLSVDTNSKNTNGVRAALRRATPAQTLEIALETAESRVLYIAAEEVALKPFLLKDVDFRNAPAQFVWTKAVTINANAWQGPADPQKSFTAVIDNLVERKTADADLIAALSKSPIADLSDYPRRAEVWHQVDDTARVNLLKATAASWLQSARSTAAVPYPLDQDLANVLLNGNALDQALQALLYTNVSAADRILSALTGYGEDRFVKILQDFAASRHRLSANDAEELGRILLQRRWARAVDSIADHVKRGREDLKLTLRICHTMVSIFTRWSLGIAPINTNEKWQMLEDIAADLYPGGPDVDRLWERAGGRNSDLQVAGNGRSRWRDALHQVRHGKEPRPDRLINEMCKDYPGNSQLRYIAVQGKLRID